MPKDTILSSINGTQSPYKDCAITKEKVCDVLSEKKKQKQNLIDNYLMIAQLENGNSFLTTSFILNKI